MIPIAVAILAVLFLVQRRGTGGIGRVFGPIMVVWFLVLGVLGVVQIAAHAERVQGRSTRCTHSTGSGSAPLNSFLTLGSIFLVVTGGEALYADMGHFGRRPIQLTWYRLVLPCLVLNYFGQAALILHEPDVEIENPFFDLAPDWAIVPLADARHDGHGHRLTGVDQRRLLAHRAGGAARLPAARQDPPHVVGAPRSGLRAARQLALMVGCIGLVLTFRIVSSLAAAYGIAVTTTMAITTMLFYVLCVYRWQWSRAKALAVCVPILFVDLAFLGANIPKIPHGGWFPLLVAFGLVIQMTHVAARAASWWPPASIAASAPITDVLDEYSDVVRVPGSAVFMFKDLGKAPPALVNNLRHNKVLHRTTLIVSVETVEVPRVERSSATRSPRSSPASTRCC